MIRDLYLAYVENHIHTQTNNTLVLKTDKKTPGQDGGVGRHTVHPRTTKRRTTTNLKTKNNQK